MMTFTGSGRRNRRKLPPEPNRAPFDGLRAEANLDYLFATDGSLGFSPFDALTTGGSGPVGGAGRGGASPVARRPRMMVGAVVMASGIRMRWCAVANSRARIARPSFAIANSRRDQTDSPSGQTPCASPIATSLGKAQPERVA
jgi:hypothetical protein